MGSVTENGNDYIGFKLSIVTLSEMRYEGVLYNINARHSTVSLADVKSFGTEGRAAPLGRVEVPSCEKIFKYVVFKGKDIQDLQVLGNREINDSAVIAVNVDPETVNASLVFNADDQIKGQARQRELFDITRRHSRADIDLDIDISTQLKKECEQAYDFSKSRGDYNREEVRKEFENANNSNSVYRRNMLTIYSGYDAGMNFYDEISNGLNRNRQFNFNSQDHQHQGDMRPPRRGIYDNQGGMFDSSRSGGLVN